MPANLPPDLMDPGDCPAPIGGGEIIFDNAEGAENVHLLLGYNLKLPKEENMLRFDDVVGEDCVVPEVDPPTDYLVPWVPDTRNDFNKKLDEIQNPPWKRNEKNCEEAVNKLNCAPVISHFLEGLSAVWKKVNGSAGIKKTQDDIGLFDGSRINDAGRKVEGNNVRKLRHVQNKCFKSTRKTAKTEMSTKGVYFEYEKSKKPKKTNQTVPQRPSPILDNDKIVGKLYAVYYEDSDGERVSSPSLPILSEPIVPVSSTPPTDPRKRKKIQPKKKSEEPFDLFKNLPKDKIKQANEILKGINKITVAPRGYSLESALNPGLLAKVRELHKAEKVGPLPGGMSRKRTHEEIEKDNPKKTKSTIKPKTSIVIDKEEFAKTFQTVSEPIERSAFPLSTPVPTVPIPIELDDMECVDEVGDETPVVPKNEQKLQPRRQNNAKNLTPSRSKNVPWRLIRLDLSDCKGVHLLRDGIPPATEYLKKRATNPDHPVDYIKNEENQTPIIPLDRAIPEPPRKRRRTQNIFELLGLKTARNLWRQYTAYPNLSIGDQIWYNTRRSIAHEERDYAARGVIRRYGDVKIANFLMPSNHPYDGLYWPIFQPIDAVAIDEEQRHLLENADVQNQIVNQTVCNYSSRRLVRLSFLYTWAVQLMCDDNPTAWNRNFSQACNNKKRKRMNLQQRDHPPTPGRFCNRVGYARCLSGVDPDKEEQNARERNRRTNEQERRNLDMQLEQQRQKVLKAHNLKDGDQIPAGYLTEYIHACRSTRLNDHIRAASRDVFSIVDRNGRFPGNRRPNPFPKHWFVIPWEEYVPSNDRRSFLCKYTNHYNFYIIGRIPTSGDMTDLARWIGAAMTAIHRAQFTNKFLIITQEDQKLCVDRQRQIERSFPRGSTVKLSDLKKVCALKEWEKKYWPRIWDHLSANFRMLPPVSMLVPTLEVPIDIAFKNVAKLENRTVYYNIYTDAKRNYLAKVKRIRQQEEQNRWRARRDRDYYDNYRGDYRR